MVSFTGEKEEVYQISPVKHVIKPVKGCSEDVKPAVRNGSPAQNISSYKLTYPECQNCNVLKVCMDMAENIAAMLNGNVYSKYKDHCAYFA